MVPPLGREGLHPAFLPNAPCYVGNFFPGPSFSGLWDGNKKLPKVVCNKVVCNFGTICFVANQQNLSIAQLIDSLLKIVYNELPIL